MPFAASDDARLLMIFVGPGLAFGVIIGGALYSAAGCGLGAFQPGSLLRRLAISPLPYASPR
jgi:hypothetical protein